MAWDYFYSLFKIEACGNLERALVLIPNCITSNMNGALDSCVFDMELIEAFNQMDPHKLSGIDGLSSLFYKENCGVVGKDVLQLCYEVLDGHTDIKDSNKVVIVFIPKIDDPKVMTHFCPISLCRFIYKMIFKALANRLKTVLLTCISQN